MAMLVNPNAPAAPASPQPRSSSGGTSRVVPVVVAAGLAVGTFCGLLFGLGNPRANAAGSDATAHAKAAADAAQQLVADAQKQAAAARPDPVQVEPAKLEPPVVAATPVDAAPADAPAVIETAILTFDVTPKDATATIIVGGGPIEGLAWKVDAAKLEHGSVEIVVKAEGYEDARQTVTADKTQTVAIALEKTQQAPDPIAKVEPRTAPKPTPVKPVASSSSASHKAPHRSTTTTSPKPPRKGGGLTDI